MKTATKEKAANTTILTAKDKFSKRLEAAGDDILLLYTRLYETHPYYEDCYNRLLKIIELAFTGRSDILQQKDLGKLARQEGPWFLSNQICGMSLYVDRFCGNLKNLTGKLDYFKELGVNLLHLMPIFESPANESDGGYAVSDFRRVDERFGSVEDLALLQQQMQQHGMYLMQDIVLNHTSRQHDWAVKALNGEKKYQDYFYFFDDRQMPDELDKTMPEIFPESSPGSFTYVPELNKWVMTVFHHYQWDLNFRNPEVFNEMLENIFFYANLGVDILRIDAPAFIWKEKGTVSQNLDEAHCLLQLIKQCVQVATPGMALLGEAIVAPAEIMKYFGTGNFVARECDFAYNATQMALQWDALATGDTRIMLAAQHELEQKPFGTSWITYTRCHDDIGLGYDDRTISNSGYDPYEHRKFIKNYYSGSFPGSIAKGALFSVNDKTGDARISGSLASLCGLEYALEKNDVALQETAIKKIILMQAQSFFIGGIPILFYGDEQGYTNDYSYLQDKSKNYDNRWMHRPVIDWNKNSNAGKDGTTENKVYTLTQKLISIRSGIAVLADKKNCTWINTENNHVAGFLRAWEDERVYCIFNFGGEETSISWYVFKQNNLKPSKLYDHWTGTVFNVGHDHEHLILQPYQFLILEPR